MLIIVIVQLNWLIAGDLGNIRVVLEPTVVTGAAAVLGAFLGAFVGGRTGAVLGASLGGAMGYNAHSEYKFIPILYRTNLRKYLFELK